MSARLLGAAVTALDIRERLQGSHQGITRRDAAAYSQQRFSKTHRTFVLGLNSVR